MLRKRCLAHTLIKPVIVPRITENLLLDLALTYPGKVTIVPFSKPIEGKTGADWAWAFESADGAYNYPMMVQAKVLDALDRDYGEIPRKIGTSSVRQIDRLIDTANGFGFPAFYAFYNHLNDLNRVPSNCHSLDITRSGPISETWGVSIAPAENVRKALNDVTFETHKAHSIPLHCLICSHAQGTPGPSGSPGRIAGNFALGTFSKMPGLPPGDPDADDLDQFGPTCRTVGGDMVALTRTPQRTKDGCQTSQKTAACRHDT